MIILRPKMIILRPKMSVLSVFGLFQNSIFQLAAPYLYSNTNLNFVSQTFVLCDVSDSLEPVVGHSYPRLRQLILDVPPTELSKVSFLPGQWVDFWPAGFEQPCGFSISSEPHMLPQMELAIKQSPHPIVEWIHSDKCSENQIVKKPVQI